MTMVVGDEEDQPNYRSSGSISRPGDREQPPRRTAREWLAEARRLLDEATARSPLPSGSSVWSDMPVPAAAPGYETVDARSLTVGMWVWFEEGQAWQQLIDVLVEDVEVLVSYQGLAGEVGVAFRPDQMVYVNG